MAKRDTTIYLKISEAMKRRVEKVARKNVRSINEQLILLIARGLHDHEFDISDYTEEDTDGKE